MSTRSLLLIGTILMLLSSTIGFAADSCWRTCQADAEALSQKGDWAQAFQRSQTALNLARAKYGPRHLNTAKSLTALADICMAWGRLQQADLFLNEALKIRTSLHGECHPSVIKLLTKRADNFRIHRESDRAEKLYRQALDLADRGGWGESSDAAPALEGLARIYLDRGEQARAEPLYRKALDICATGGKYRRPEKLCEARCSISLADIKREKRDFDEAAALYEAAVRKYSDVCGPESPMIAVTYKRLADVTMDRGMPSLALTYFKRALGAYDRTGLPEEAFSAATLVGLANLLKSQGKTAKAKELHSSADSIYRRTGVLDRELATMLLTKEGIWPARKWK